MKKCIRQASLEKDPELSFGDVKFAIDIRHPSRDAKEAVGYVGLDQGRHLGWRYEFGCISTKMLFKATNLDHITSGVITGRK